MTWEYRVVPAPVKARRARGARAAELAFARAIEHVINEMAAGGWEYCRAEMLPQEERRGRITYRNLLVFRRAADAAEARLDARAPDARPEAPELSESAADPRIEPRPGLAARMRGGAGWLVDELRGRSTRREPLPPDVSLPEEGTPGDEPPLRGDRRRPTPRSD